MNITYQRLKPAQAKEYRQIRLECLLNYPQNFGSTFSEESAKPKLVFEEHIEKQTKGHFVVGAFDSGNIIGICGFSQEPRRKVQHLGSIIQMYVSKSYSGQGVGLALIGKTIEEAFKMPEIEQIMLSVVSSNKSANLLYEKAGFKEYGYQSKYFKEGSEYFDQRFMTLYR